MRSGAVAAGLLVAALLAPAATARQESGVGSPRLVDPRSGRQATLPEGARLLHVVFFATWCPECLAELEALSELEERWSDRGYRLVVVAVRTRQSVERLAHFIDESRPPGTLLFDAEGSAEKALGVQRVPTHVLLDAAGTEIGRSGSLADLEADIERHLAGPGRRP